MAELPKFMELIDIRAQHVVDDFLSSLIVSGDLHLRDLGGFDFRLYENLTGAHFGARCRKNEKYSDVTDAELRPLFDNGEFERMDELLLRCVRDVLDIDVTPEEDED